MAFCSQCGTQLDESAAVCPQCGQPTRKAAAAAAAGAAGAQATAAAAQPAPQPAAQPAPQPVTPAQQPVAPSAQQFAGQQPAAPYGIPQQTEGCIGAAWNDIKGTPGWFKRILLLCLVGCVPILNFAVDGYAIRWAREVTFGNRTGMPKQLFRKKEISTGFCVMLVRLVYLFLTIAIFLLNVAVLAGLFALFSPAAAGIIAVVVFFAYILAYVFVVAPVTNIAIIRMGVAGYLEAAFNLPKIFAAYKKSVGSAIGCSILPTLIAGLISGLITGVLIALMTAIVGADVMGTRGMMSINGFSPYYLTSLAQRSIFAVILFSMLIYVCQTVMALFGSLFAIRSFGHFASRFAPEWASDSDEGLSTANQAASPGL